MRVFVTGATGFIGSAIVNELIGAGHQVVGLARSDASAASLEAKNVAVQRGTLEDLDSLKRAAQASDGVIHAGYNHDWMRNTDGDFFALFMAAAETDRRAIEAMGSALAGSDRPLVISSGLLGLAPGRLGTEDDAGDPASPRNASELLTLAMAQSGVRTSVVRLPPSVHGDGDHGFVPALIGIARANGVSGYVADGSNRWPAVHRLDAAVLYRLAAEKAPAGSRLHGSAEEGVPFREIATAIGKQLNLPVVSVPAEAAEEHFGRMGRFVAMDAPNSSRLTRERLGWNPTHPTLLADLEHGTYFEQQVNA
ncbi:MAG: SDR family oxidoreductase [Candidatus Aquilonibacter sp.]